MIEPTVLEIAVEIAKSVAVVTWREPKAAVARACLELATELKAQRRQPLTSKTDGKTVIGYISLLDDGRFLALVESRSLPEGSVGPEDVGIATDPSYSLSRVIDEARKIHQEGGRAK
jgi:hypothetical protein